MKRIAIAGFQHETNTFSPIPTSLADFSGKQESNKLRDLGLSRYNSPVSGFIRRAGSLDFEIIPLVGYGAEPSGAVPMPVFEHIMEDILSRIQAVSCDGMFLDLHGAMVLEGYLDGETEILKRLRAVVGGIPIVASLDLHGNIAPKTLDLCSMLISCREYPHTDMYETGERCADAMAYLLTEKKVFHAHRMIPFLFPTSKESTFSEPMRSLYQLIEQVESWDGVLSASVMQGFAGADVTHMGPSVFAYAEQPDLAEKAVDLVYDSFLARESEFTSDVAGVEEAVSGALLLAQNTTKPVVLADIQDNPGGGSSSDTMFLVKELLRQGARDAVAGMIFDPDSAAQAYAAGEGSQVELELGGRYIPGDSPLKAVFKVERLHEGIVTGTGPMAKGLQFNLGKMALLRLEGVLIVVGSLRLQAADQCLFTVLGVEPGKMKIVVVKSANHFRADFEPIAEKVIPVLAPGCDVEDPSTFTFRNLRSGVRLKGLGKVQP